ncbi:hypothetical protein B0H13DRAFT_2312718 [Mycena leptocephala]|nr:hypothetical protein B0H13DRAFT_2312718 [Mycena leptocephala]
MPVRESARASERCASSTLRVEFWAWFLSWLPGFLCPHAATRPGDETASVRRAQALPSDLHPTQYPTLETEGGIEKRGMDHREREWEMRQIDVDMGMGMGYRDADLTQPLQTDSKALRVAIIAENFLLKIDGSTITLVHLLHHLAATRARVMLLGPEIGMPGCLGCLALTYILKLYLPRLLPCPRTFASHVIHLVDPTWLGVQALIALHILFPGTPIVTSHHTNLPTYAEIFGYALVSSPSTVRLLREKAWANIRVSTPLPIPARLVRCRPAGLVILSVDRLSLEKNLSLVVWEVTALEM